MIKSFISMTSFLIITILISFASACSKLHHLSSLSIRSLDSTSSNTLYQYSMTNNQNEFYTVQVAIGYNNQLFNLAVVTGTSDIWIMDPILSGVITNNTFSCNSSATCINLNSSAISTYWMNGNGGIASGTMVTDSIAFGNGVFVTGQNFIVANFTNFTMTGIDGILGLQFNPQSQGIIDNLLNQGIISGRSFSLFASNNPGDTDNLSQITFNGYSSGSMIGSAFIYFPILNPITNMWLVGLINATLGVFNLNITSNYAWIDSGNPYISPPINDWSQLINALQSIDISCNGDNLTCTCANGQTDIYSFPPLAFYIGDSIYNQQFLIPPDQYLSWNGNNCTILFSKNPSNNYWIFGNTWLTNFYTYFDMDHTVVGFALAIGTNASSIPGNWYAQLPAFGLIIYFDYLLFALLYLILLI